jgi:hypothetical protein
MTVTWYGAYNRPESVEDNGPPVQTNPSNDSPPMFFPHGTNPPFTESFLFWTLVTAGIIIVVMLMAHIIVHLWRQKTAREGGAGGGGTRNIDVGEQNILRNIQARNLASLKK